MKSLLVVALLAAIGLAGCTSSTPSIDYEMPPTDEEGRYVIEMTSSFKFVPENAAVPAGSTVIWKNLGGSHNAEAEDGAWQQGPVSSEDFILNVTDEMVGEHYYVCVPHESLGMYGYLKVLESERFQPS